MSTGSIRSGGYQFMHGDHATLKREQPIKRIVLANDAVVQIVPLTGSSRRRMFDVCATWTQGTTSCSSTYIAGDELEAVAEYQRIVRRLQP